MFGGRGSIFGESDGAGLAKEPRFEEIGLLPCLKGELMLSFLPFTEDKKLDGKWFYADNDSRDSRQTREGVW